MPSQRAPRRGVAVALILLLLVALASLWLSREAILGGIGNLLVVSEDPVKSDVIVVLAGGWGGERISKAKELLQNGSAPVVLMCSPPPAYGMAECELASRYLEQIGGDRKRVQCIAGQPRSTDEEARLVAAELKARGVRSFLLVTSDFHTRRARRIFQTYTQGISFRTLAAPSVDFQPGEWYKTREGRKAVFLEWTKTLTGPLGV